MAQLLPTERYDYITGQCQIILDIYKLLPRNKYSTTDSNTTYHINTTHTYPIVKTTRYRLECGPIYMSYRRFDKTRPPSEKLWEKSGIMMTYQDYKKALKQLTLLFHIYQLVCIHMTFRV